MVQGVGGQEVGVEAAAGAREAQCLALHLRLDVGNHVLDIFIQTSINVFSASSAVNILSVTVGAVVDRFAGGEQLTEVGDRDGVVVGVGDVLAAVHVETQLPTLVQAGDVGRGVDNVVSTELTHNSFTGAGHGGVTRVPNTGTRGSVEQVEEDDTSSEASHGDEKLRWS